VLGQALTGARPETPGQQIELINIGNTRDLNRIPNDVVEYYISLGDNQIDGILSQMYYTPLVQCANGQWTLDTDINEYNQTIEISDASNLVPGDQIVIRDDDTGVEEHHIVESIVDQYSFTVMDPIGTFSGNEVRVIRIQYPPPINQISARYAASFIYDKYFSAQNAPNVSDYGKTMRNIAMGQINDILNGRSVLKCQRRKGDLHGNPWIDSSYAHRELPQGYDTGRDMSKLE
jgi:hypothetical protein